MLAADAMATSAPSNLNFRVEPLQFGSGLLEGELPVDGSLLGVCLCGLGSDFRLQSRDVADAAVGQALAGQAAQFAFRDIEPTTVLGCVDEVDPPHVFACFLGRECFVECPLRMRVQVVADQSDLRRLRVSGVEQLGDFMSPIDFGAVRIGPSLAGRLTAVRRT